MLPIGLLLPVYPALPLMIYQPHLSFTDAYLEAMSRRTTPSAATLPGLKRPAAFDQAMAHPGRRGSDRAQTILPLQGVGGRQIYKAETSGPMKDIEPTPGMRKTAMRAM